MAGSGDKPAVVVLGGCGFIGRNVVEYLVSNALVSKLCVVDKTPPQTAWLNNKHSLIYENPIVEFRSANLINPTSCKNALEPDAGGPLWHTVINCAGETKPGQTDAVYREGILNLSTNVAKECSRLGVRLVEISSGYMYSSEKTAHQEQDDIEPWTFEGIWKSKVESQLQSMKGDLKYTIVRPPLTYGIGDRRNLVPRLLLGAIYKHLGEVMKLLWTNELKLNTIHVRDLVKAIWFVSNRDDSIGEIYNVVDKGETTHGDIINIVADLFNIQFEFIGNIMSNIAKTDLPSVIEEANDKHLTAWAQMCVIDNICNTPLDPTTRAEHLLNKHCNIDGNKLEKLGFIMDVPKPNVDNVREIVRDLIEMQIFPKTALL